MSVQPLDLAFDPPSLVNNTKGILRKYEGTMKSQGYGGINLRRPADKTDKEGLWYGCGSLWDPILNAWTARDIEWTTTIGYFNTLYIQKVVDRIGEYAASEHQCTLGRARILTLKPKTCLTWHTDHGNYIRFHVPLITNPGAMFIHKQPDQEVVSRMSEVGRLYSFDASIPHTAVNASYDTRVHLVVVGCKPQITN